MPSLLDRDFHDENFIDRAEGAAYQVSRLARSPGSVDLSNGGEIDGNLQVTGNTTLSGDVGIGTTSPGELLEVNGGALAVVGTKTAWQASTSYIDNNAGEMRLFAAGPDATTIGSFRLQIAESDGGNPINALYIDNNGNVGIGTTSPSQALEVSGTIQVTGATANTFLTGHEARFTRGGANYIWADTASGYVLIGVNGDAKSLANAALAVRANGDIEIQNGNVGIGRTSPNQKLSVLDDVVGFAASIVNDGNASTRSGLVITAGEDANPSHTAISFRDGDGGAIGSVTGDGAGGVNYNQTSDERRKQDVTPLGSTLDAVLNLQPVRYRGKGAPVERPKTVGLIAQDVQPYVPEAVSQGPDTELLSLSYSRLIPYLIGAIQELESRVAALEAV